MTGYTETIKKYAADESHIGALPDADGTGEVGLGADEAGKRLAVRFAIHVANETVSAVRFQVFGCGFTIAASAAAAQLAEGQSLAEALAIDAAAVDAALGGLPQERSYCAELAIEALHAAVQSVRSGSAVKTNLQPADEEDHGPRVDAKDPVYRALIDSPASSGISTEARHLFACLLAVAAQEKGDPADALGLTQEDLTATLDLWFPAFDPALLGSSPGAPAPEINVEVRDILLSHVPKDKDGSPVPASRWLAQALAARAARPGHLWVAMGLFERPELTAAIRRHLPSLAAANNQGMRWKRYLFKQVCDLGGGTMCKSPNCGVCSDYALCFGPD